MQFYVNGKKERYNPYHMKKDKFLGEGKEAKVYQIDDKAVKFFKQYTGKKIILAKDAVEKMKNIHTRRILLPTDALLDKKHNLRGYKMDYVEDLGIDSYFSLNKYKLQEENELLREDIEVLSDNKVLIEDLIHVNTSYHNGLYLIDPGSYQFDSSMNANQVYGINMDTMNNYLIQEVIRHYHLVKYSKLNNYMSYNFSREINKEYNRSGKNDVIEFLSDIEEDSLAEFVDKRIK